MPHIHHVIFHRPGPGWLAGASFREQPGVEQHVAYFKALLERGELFAGGPFTDSSGGMCIMSAGLTREVVEKIAAEDPTVQSGLLEAEVRPWMRAMSADPAS